ncbi:hypothetical protein GCM10027084_09460 [Pseudoxanthomonas sangjuensis]
MGANADRASELRVPRGLHAGAVARLHRLHALSWLVLVLGCLISILFGWLVWGLARDGTASPGALPIVAMSACGVFFSALVSALLRQLARAYRRNRAMVDAVADHLPALIAYIGRDGRYGFTNRAVRDWFSAAENWSGRHFAEAHAGDPVFRASLQRAMDDCTPEHWICWQAELGAPPRPVQAYLVPDLDKNRRIAGWYLMACDTSEQQQAYRELAQARDQLQRVTDIMPAYLAEYDRDGTLVFFNRACAESEVWRARYRPGVTMRELIGERLYRDCEPQVESALAGQTAEYENVVPGGSGFRRLHSYFTPDVDEDGRVRGLLVLTTDITEKIQLEQALYDANERAQVTLSSIREAVVSIDVDSCVTYMNPAAEQLSGWSCDEALGQPLQRVLPLRPAQQAENGDGLQSYAVAGDQELVRRDGRHILVEHSQSPLHDRDEARVGSVLVLRDVTEARALTARMAYLAHHDPLTGLPNRLQLNDTLGQLIGTATRHGHGLAVLFIDLDLFKHVNDALGHHIGDQLLQQVARRIQRSVGRDGSVYRTGGDEFVVLLDNVVTRNKVNQIVELLLEIGATPYALASHELHQAFSIGVGLFPDDGYDAATLMMRADAAMYLAKRSGRNVCRFYTRELAASVDARIELENSLRRGLRNGELSLHYQPQISGIDGRVVGVEALLRWQRRDRLVLPAEFLPIAEETNLIVEIDQWAIRAACRQNRLWQQAGLPPIRVSVNIAAANFDTDNLMQTVLAALEESGMPAELLELEVTETTLIRDVQRTDRSLRALKALGVGIAIDDFGTGFSSLSYLGNYGFNVLKIDRSFVHDVVEPSQGAITRAIIGLANQLQCRTIAEGVETEEQLQWLVDNSCDELQGYLFSPPLPADEIARLLASGRAWPIPDTNAVQPVPWV